MSAHNVCLFHHKSLHLLPCTQSSLPCLKCKTGGALLFFPPPFRWKASSQFVQVFFYHHFKYDFDTIFAGGRKFTSSLKQHISEGRVEGQTHRFHLDTLKCENIHNHTLASAAVGPSDGDIYFYICIYWFIYVISYIFPSWQGGSVERRFSYQNCCVTAGMPPCTAHLIWSG